MESGLVSIVIATYNRKELLSKAIDSILSQTHKKLEIIVSDDYSSDGTEEYIKEKYESDERVIYSLNGFSKGASESRKFGFSKSKGEFVVFFDDDDYFIDDSYFAKAVKLFNENKVISFVGCNYKIYNITNKTTTDKKMPYAEIVDNKEYFLNFCKEGYPKPISVMYRRKAMKATKFDEMIIFNDTPQMLRALWYGPMGFIDTFGIEYLVHGDNMSFNGNFKFIKENIDEKYAIYKESVKIKFLPKKELKQWLIDQTNVTAFHYIHGSKPSKLNFYRLLWWSFWKAKNRSAIKQYFVEYKWAMTHKYEIK